MRIGQLSKETGVSRDTIRFYERHGLIRSEVDAAAANGYRIYPEDAVLTLEVIRDAQAAGLTIAQITIFMGQFVGQDPQGDALDFLDAQIAEVKARITASQRFLSMLKDTRAALERAPQDGLDQVEKAGAGNENRTRN